MSESNKGLSRRDFLKTALTGATGAVMAISGIPALERNNFLNLIQAETTLRVAERSISFKVAHWVELGEKLVADHPDMNLKVEVGQLGLGADYIQAILTNLSAGTPYDLFWVVDVENYQLFGSKGVIQPLDPFIEKDKYDISPFLPTVIKFFTWPDQGLHMLPTGIHNGALNLFYNKDVLDKAGVPYPTLDTTTDELAEMAAKVSDNSKTIYGLGMAVDWLEQQVMMARSYGGDILNPEGTESWVLHPETVAAYDYMRKNVVETKITPAPKTFDDNSKAFVSGSIIISWDGPWRMAEYNTAIKDFAWDMTLTSKGPAGRHGQLVQEGYPMAKDSKLQDLAWEFVKLQSSKEDGIARPPLGFISAARQDSILDPALMADPHYALYAQDMVDNTSRAPTLPANYRISELFTNMTDFTSPIWTGESSVEDGLNQLDVAVQDILSKPAP